MVVFAVDFDGCAALYPERVNALYEHPDHVVIIHTARSPALRVETEEALARLGVRYHALVMGKLRADVYIDDRNAGGLQWPNAASYS